MNESYTQASSQSQSSSFLLYKIDTLLTHPSVQRQAQQSSISCKERRLLAVLDEHSYVN